MRIGVKGAREHGLPDAAVPVVVERLADTGLSADVVTSFLRLLSSHRSTPVIELLLSFVLHSRLLGRPRLAPRSPEMLAALSSLAIMAPDDGRARLAIELARTSNDPAVREAARTRSA
jgi:hypothetical protein